MSTLSMMQRTKRNQELVEKSRKDGKRQALKDIIKSADKSPEEKMEAMIALQKRPVNESATRLKSRCPNCGRIKGFYRRFNLCRCCIRKFFVMGYLPGVVKSSW